MTQNDDLAKKLKECALNFWETYGTPLLLSNIPRVLDSSMSGYKDVLAGRTLKEFVVETGKEFGYRLVEHPTQRAKIAILPDEIAFDFPSNQSNFRERRHERSSSENVVMAFLKKLNELSPEEVDKVIIPTSVLVKLLR